MTVGEGAVIGRGVCVENDVAIGAFTKIQTNAYITAGTTLEDHVFIAPGVTSRPTTTSWAAPSAATP